MRNKIWFAFNYWKATMKDAFGIRMTDWEKFIIEIGP